MLVNLVNFRSLVDIAIVSFLIYRILVLLVGTRAIQLIKGVFFLTLLLGVAFLFRLSLLTWFLQTTLLALMLSMPIVFQPELRKMLEEIGKGRFYIKSGLSSDEADVRVKHITGALGYLKAHKIGALLVFQQDVGLGDYTETAIPLHSRITQELIISIFWKDNPLHDGAVILNKRELVAGGCYLPLADAPEISRWYGTRHRAALGISEVSDAIVIIVSEERGDISLAVKGRLSKNIKDFQLERLLHHYFAGEQVLTGWKLWSKSLSNIFWVKNAGQDAGGLVK
ncbi:MAG: diadenylate cyclase CdaA [Synergistaceae bacterium]|nr:diadenylate cyclase CdaA [Synergistaceae bacterium]MBQ6982066.1 diadenylate cyclase CdaA [Synergistaceae bacterium]MBR0248198.1 diadenylate cyclase CdaA [Synergistaceae bacterium]